MLRSRENSADKGSNMIRKSVLAAAVLGLGSTASNPAIAAEDGDTSTFERVSTFLVCENSSCDRAVVDETSAEIIAASSDGLTLVYTDSPNRSLGFIDITDPAAPVALGAMTLDGEPTSVAVLGEYAVVGVNTSGDYVSPSGYLGVYELSACAASPAQCVPTMTIPLAGQPDSIAVSPDGRYVAVAIENERDEDIEVDGVEGGLPQAPAGLLQVVRTDVPVNTWAAYSVDLSGLSAYAPTDPEPEYLSINRRNIAAVTLQENNHIVLVDLATGSVLTDYAAGTVNLEHVDTEDDGLLDPVGALNAVPREPDAVSWVNDFAFATANEGDLFGGSRGFTLWGARGVPLFDSGTDLEYLALAHGHYPDGRADNKGVEPESVVAAQYGENNKLFVGSERANFVAVYDLVSAREPVFRQLLPSGIAPEGLLPIPGRNLFVIAAENDEDLRSTVTIYQLQAAPASYPTVVSDTRSDGELAGIAPIGWVALSALAADREDPSKLYTVHDSFLKQSRIYSMDVSAVPAHITAETVLKKGGVTVDYDLEGLAQRDDGSFWAVSEGSGTSTTPNLLLLIAADGTVLEEIGLPPEVVALQKNNGFEGVTVTGHGTGELVYVAFQREWTGDPTGYARIGRYAPATGAWKFFYYPLDAVASPAGGWVGLSEITALDAQTLLVLERDNQGGPDARIKRLYTVSLQHRKPGSQGEAFPVLRKRLARDLIPDLAAPQGWLQEKVEGVGIGADDSVYIVTDNDGVDENTGETQFIRLGTRSELRF